jgi:(R,R)-butanediol dehydrogenase/meso-butanediol dehydrogenase/diacetyl reductase/L-iditol 2-dehydrogenase
MKAIVLKGKGLIEYQDVPEPECAPDEIKVKIAYAGICGSDPKIIEGAAPVIPDGAIGRNQKFTGMLSDKLPVLGHEASGTIVQIGKNIKGDFKVGQHVAMNFRRACGGCYYCSNGMEHFCERIAVCSGTMAEYTVFKEGMVFPLPDDLPLEYGALLEPLAIAVHTIDIAKVKIGDSVIITGGGSIGLLALQLAVRSGAAKVLVSEPIAEKRKVAKLLGADVVVDPLKEDLLEIANKLTDDRGFNVCIEASGAPAVARQLILLAENCGHIVWVASYPGGLDIGVPIDYMFSRELSIHSVKISQYAFPRSAQILPKLNLKPMITVYPLQDVIKAFKDYKKGHGIKILLQP